MVGARRTRHPHGGLEGWVQGGPRNVGYGPAERRGNRVATSPAAPPVTVAGVAPGEQGA